MKIAVFHNLTSGGGKRALEEYCKGLCKRGHSLDLFIMDTADEKYLPLDGYVRQKKIHPVRSVGIFRLPDYNSRTISSGWKWLVALQRMQRVQKQMAGDINIGRYDLALVCGCIYTQAPFILRYLQIPSVYICQEPLRTLYESPELQDLDNMRGRMYLMCARLLLKRIDAQNIQRATKVIANSYYSRESILRAYGIDSQVNYLGVDTQKFKPIDISKDSMVLSLGGLQPRKGFRFIIKALACIDKSIRPTFVIIADKHYYGEEHILHSLSRQLGVDLDIRIGVSDEEVVQYYNKAKAIVFAPFLEPFGLVVLEAMACGTPVIAIREGGIREIVIDRENGVLLDRDVSQFAKAVEEIMLDHDKAARLSSRAREYVKDCWSWDKAVESLEYNFKSLLNLNISKGEDCSDG